MPPEREQSDPTKQTVAHLVGSLTGVQLWVLLGVLGGLLGSSYTAGALLQPTVNTWLNRPLTCKETHPWPLGNWRVTGVQVDGEKDDDANKVEFNSTLTFEKPTAGIWFSSYKKKNQSDTFSLDASPNDNASFHLSYIADSRVLSVNSLTLSDSGCSMTGAFVGQEASGFVQYCWEASPRCPAIPLGYRPPKPIPSR